jgi:hypothetical protein
LKGHFDITIETRGRRGENVTSEVLGEGGENRVLLVQPSGNRRAQRDGAGVRGGHHCGEDLNIERNRAKKGNSNRAKPEDHSNEIDESLLHDQKQEGQEFWALSRKLFERLERWPIAGEEGVIVSAVNSPLRRTSHPQIKRS